ncbi:hypothetical protein F1880_008053 [Penicillium rolfsii]|nr:hypothetical protein F1880_008053 [Penicillium rolfsii]
MKLLYETELMKNQKQAQLFSPSGSFQVIQTSAGYAVFFFIGSDGAFYAAREAPDTPTGWTRQELSSSIANAQGSNPIVVKSFALCQNPKDLLFDLALVVTIANSDHLYFSGSNDSRNAAWAGKVEWKDLSFDAEAKPDQVVIADVFLMNTPGRNKVNIQNFFVDIQRAPFNSLQLLDRYYIKPDSSPCWNRHSLAMELKVGSVKSCPGYRHGDRVPGIYTLGAVGGPSGNEKVDTAPPERIQLIYTPQSNPFNSEVAPSPSRLNLPDEARIQFTCIASVPNSEGDTNLFVATQGGLYLFSADNQYDRAEPKRIVGSSQIFKDVKQLSAATVNSATTVWALNDQGELFYFSCAAGKEAQPEAWSTSPPILVQVNQFSAYINGDDSSNVIFAQYHGHNLDQLVQDPTTSAWSTRTIVLPTTDSGKVFEYHSSTTRIVTADDLGRAVPDKPLTISSSTYMSFYVNNVYYALTPSKPLDFKSDDTGEITIVLESNSLEIAPFTVALKGAAVEPVIVDPLVKAKAKLLTIKDGGSLANIAIKLEDGTTKPLLPSTVTEKQREKAAQTLVQLGEVSKKLDPTSARKKREELGDDQPPIMFAIDFSDPDFAYYEGQDKINDFLSSKRKKRSLENAELFGDFGDAIKAKIGDLLQTFSYFAGRVGMIAIRTVKGVYDLVVEMGTSLYNAVVDTAQAVVGVMQVVFHKLKVAYDDLVSWLGFVFDWQDILRTQAAIKGVYKLWTSQLVASLNSLRKSSDAMFDGLSDHVTEMAGMKPIGRTTATVLEDPKSSNSGGPQSSWGTYHFKNGAQASQAEYKPSTNISSQCDNLLTKLQEVADREVNDVQNVISAFKTEVADRLPELDPVEAVKKTLALCSVVLLKTAKNVLAAILDLVQAILQAVLDGVDTPIDIPVITWMYEKVTGQKEMSILDLFCLICAIPSTVIYKLMSGKAPFPDDRILQEVQRLQNLIPKERIVPRGLDSDGKGLVRVGEATEEQGHRGLPEEAKRVIVAIANIATLPGFVLVRLTNRKAKLPPGTAISWKSALFEFLADIIFDFPCYAWSITEIGSDAMDWPYVVNLNVSTFNFVLRAVKTRTPSRTHWAVVDASLGIVFLVADAGYFKRLQKAANSDIASLASEILESSAVLLEVFVALGENSSNPYVKAAAEIAEIGEFVCEVGYTTSCLVTAGYTINEI